MTPVAWWFCISSNWDTMMLHVSIRWKLVGKTSCLKIWLVNLEFEIYTCVKKMTLVSKKMAWFSPPCLFLPSLEGGWVGWRDDTEEILGIRTTHGQLPLLIHLPYRHFLSLSTLTKLLVRGGGWQRIYIQRERERGRMNSPGLRGHWARARDGHKQIHREKQCTLWHTSSQWQKGRWQLKEAHKSFLYVGPLYSVFTPLLASFCFCISPYEKLSLPTPVHLYFPKDDLIHACMWLENTVSFTGSLHHTHPQF